MQIIALGHKARQGKTTGAAYLARVLSGRNLVLGFGDAIKTVARVTEGMTTKDAQLLQKVGWAYREEDPTIWIRAWQGTLDDHFDLDRVIIPDLRCRNEAEYLREKGALLIKVTRIVGGKVYLAEDRPADHPSETELDDWHDWDLSVVAKDISQLRTELSKGVISLPPRLASVPD